MRKIKQKITALNKITKRIFLDKNHQKIHNFIHY